MLSGALLWNVSELSVDRIGSVRGQASERFRDDSKLLPHHIEKLG